MLGLLQDLECHMSDCWNTTALPDSTTTCYGTMGSFCNYSCFSGFEAVGARRCVANTDRITGCIGHGILRDCRLGFNGGACATCATGRSRAGISSSGCEACVTGQYAESVQSVQCTSCPSGMYANESGTTNCKP